MSSTQISENSGEVVVASDEAIPTTPATNVDESFEVDAIQRRVAARKIARELERKKKEAEDELRRHLMARAMRARSKPAPVETPSLWSKISSAALAVIRSKTTHNVLAYGSLALMVVGLGGYAYQLNAERVAAAFRDHCHENNMKYAIGSRMYCYDVGRFAHKITDNGVAGRMDLDFSINQRELRLAIREADRAAGPVAKPVSMSPVVTRPVVQTVAPAANPPAPARPVSLIVAKPNEGAARSIPELASQLARYDAVPLNLR